MDWDGDRGPLATLVLFGPRWMCGLPLFILGAAAAVYQRRLLWPLAVAAVVIVGPIMGFQFRLPLAAHDVKLRVLTCNIDGPLCRPDALAALVAEQQPDVVALQEVTGAELPQWPTGWHVAARDEYVVASRWPIELLDWVRRPTGRPDISAIRCAVTLPDRTLEVFDVHLATPRPGLEAMLHRRGTLPDWNSESLAAVLQSRPSKAKRPRPGSNRSTAHRS